MNLVLNILSHTSIHCTVMLLNCTFVYDRNFPMSVLYSIIGLWNRCQSHLNSYWYSRHCFPVLIWAFNWVEYLSMLNIRKVHNAADLKACSLPYQTLWLSDAPPWNIHDYCWKIFNVMKEQIVLYILSTSVKFIGNLADLLISRNLHFLYEIEQTHIFLNNVDKYNKICNKHTAVSRYILVPEKNVLIFEYAKYNKTFCFSFLDVYLKNFQKIVYNMVKISFWEFVI